MIPQRIIHSGTQYNVLPLFTLKHELKLNYYSQFKSVSVLALNIKIRIDINQCFSLSCPGFASIANVLTKNKQMETTGHILRFLLNSAVTN